jgi:hypothetical protein
MNIFNRWRNHAFSRRTSKKLRKGLQVGNEVFRKGKSENPHKIQTFRRISDVSLAVVSKNKNIHQKRLDKVVWWHSC